MLATLADSAIGAYQRYISPHKGFRCAHQAYTGRRSCSAYARAVVRRLGVSALFTALPGQFERCRAAYAALARTGARAAGSARAGSGKRRWRDHCDCAGGCDLPCSLGRLGRKGRDCDGPGDCDGGPCDCSP